MSLFFFFLVLLLPLVFCHTSLSREIVLIPQRFSTLLLSTYLRPFVISLTLCLTFQPAVSITGILNSISILADSCRFFHSLPILFWGSSFTLNCTILQTNPTELLISVPPNCLCDSNRCCKACLITLNLYIFCPRSLSVYDIGHQQPAKSWFPFWLRPFNRGVEYQEKCLGCRVSQLWEVESEDYSYQGTYRSWRLKFLLQLMLVIFQTNFSLPN